MFSCSRAHTHRPIYVNRQHRCTICGDEIELRGGNWVSSLEISAAAGNQLATSALQGKGVEVRRIGGQTTFWTELPLIELG